MDCIQLIMLNHGNSGDCAPPPQSWPVGDACSIGGGRECLIRNKTQFSVIQPFTWLFQRHDPRKPSFSWKCYKAGSGISVILRQQLVMDKEDTWLTCIFAVCGSQSFRSILLIRQLPKHYRSVSGTPKKQNQSFVKKQNNPPLDFAHYQKRAQREGRIYPPSS